MAGLGVGLAVIENLVVVKTADVAIFKCDPMVEPFRRGVRFAQMVFADERGRIAFVFQD